jgi:hypothetical protein
LVGSGVGPPLASKAAPSGARSGCHSQGTVTRDQDQGGRLGYRVWTRAGDPVQVDGVGWWRRRGDAAAALAWVTPVSGARCLALAGHVRALPDRQVHELLGALPRERFDRLVEAAYRPEGTAA